jgi:RHS repeat-associated protein
LAHDAWGKRRSANGISDTTDSLVGLTTDRGFTLHEHLDEMGVVHMNGRIYDPLIGRVMSADPFIQAPSMLQSHNRYSYVMNNPLNLTDPSGYFSFRKFLGYAVFGIHGGSSTVRTGITMALCSYGPATCGAATAMNAYISGASTRQALRSGGVALLSALAFQAAGGVGPEGATAEEAARSVERYAAHATAGCVSAAMGGGQCGTGAVSAVVGKFTSNQIAGIGAQDLGGDIARGIATSVAGGVGSVIAGGKFENGAKTAAYGYLFNELLTLGNRREAMLRSGYDIPSYIRYEQGTGIFTLIDGLSGNEMVLGSGYSGAGDGRNNSAMQGERRVGVIPEGNYAIGEMRDSSFSNGIPVEAGMRLTPLTHMPNGRDGFWIHDPLIPTTGCICSVLNVRQAISATGVQRLQVVK